MKLVNISNKVIHVGSTALIPDDAGVTNVMNITPEQAETPAVKLLIKMNLLRLDDSEERAAEIAAKAKAEAEEEMAAKAEAEAAKKATEAETKAKAKADKEAKKAAEANK